MSLQLPVIDARSPGYRTALDQLRAQLSPSGNVVSEKGRALTERVFGSALTPEQVVDRILNDVRSRGLEAVLHYSRELDGAELDPSSLRVPEEKMQEAHASAAPEMLAAVRAIADNIRKFQNAILHTDVAFIPRPGVRLDQRYVPIDRIGVCVPGGAAAYPSTVMMTVLPAQAAGVREIAVVAPPTQFGAFNTDVLATCWELGVREIYPIGGAQAVAAMAYGIEGLPAVDKIVGPGSLFVALAKKAVYGQVDIDSIAGPSEVVVIADDSTCAAYAAADMLAQAEHSPGASLLITWHEELLEQVNIELDRQIAVLERGALASQSLQSFGGCILVKDADQAIAITDELAPEHLHIACREPRKLAYRIRHAGATFLGPYSPVAVGDYAAGPSHVIPTGGTARWAAGLSANSFLRSGSIIEFSQDALADIAPYIARIADCEGLTAHKRSVTIRTEQ
ncbi:MAG: histidinol dehydrogenase [Pirellulales bacterium]